MERSIWCASGPELSILATTIAISISEMYDATDLLTIAGFIVSIGDTLSLLATQKGRCEASKIISSNSTNTTSNNLLADSQNS